MDNLFQALISTQTAVLPDPVVLRYARLASWAVVLLFVVACLGRNWPRPVRLATQLGLLGWLLLPGPWSLALWLGLAFQMPSLTSTALCLAGLWLARHGGPQALTRIFDGAWWRLARGAGIVAGWLLLLDTLAVFPFSLYDWGFSALAPVVAAALILLPWILAGARPRAWAPTLLLGAVQLSYVLLRLPAGNLWTALLDPLLWLVLQGWWIAGLAGRLKGRPRRAAATRV